LIHGYQEMFLNLNIKLKIIVHKKITTSHDYIPVILATGFEGELQAPQKSFVY